MKNLRKLFGIVLLLGMMFCLTACMDDEYSDDYEYSEDDSDDDDTEFAAEGDSESGDESDAQKTRSRSKNSNADYDYEDDDYDDYDDYDEYGSDVPISVLYGDTEDRTTEEFLLNHPLYEEPLSTGDLPDSSLIKYGPWVNEDTDETYTFYDNGGWEKTNSFGDTIEATGAFELCGDWLRIYFDDGSAPIWMFDFDSGLYTGQLGRLEATNWYYDY